MIRPPPRSTLFPSRRSSDLKMNNQEAMPYTNGTAGWAGLSPDGNLGLANSVDVTGTPSVMGDTQLYNRSEEHTSELQSQFHLVCRLLLEKKKYTIIVSVLQ